MKSSSCNQNKATVNKKLVSAPQRFHLGMRAGIHYDKSLIYDVIELNLDDLGIAGIPIPARSLLLSLYNYKKKKYQ